MLLADIFTKVVDERAPVGFRAYDGSSAGPPDATAVLEVIRRDAIAYIATARGDLGLARAYVSGALDVRGDLYAALHALLMYARGLPRRERLAVLSRIGPRALRRPPLPMEEAPAPWRRGLRHSKARDAAAISHHYDVSNRFYELVLGPSMAYTCAVFPSADRDAGGSAGREVRPGLPQARAAAGEPPARRGRRLGRHGHARRRAPRRPGAGRHAVAAAGRLGAARDRRARPPGSRRGALPRLPRRGRGRLRRRLVDRADRAHRRAQPPVLLQLPRRQAAARRANTEPHDHAPYDARAAPRRRVHRPLRVPRRRARGRRHDRLGHAGPRAARCATRRTCASTTR